MSDRIQVIQYKGQKILFNNSSNLKGPEAAALVPEITGIMIAQRINLIFHDVTGSTTDETVKKASVESVEQVTAALGKSIHSAFIGIRGIQKIIANAACRGQYFASTKEEALDWLVKQND